MRINSGRSEVQQVRRSGDEPLFNGLIESITTISATNNRSVNI
jgi:hypothetical protein